MEGEIGRAVDDIESLGKTSTMDGELKKFALDVQARQDVGRADGNAELRENGSADGIHQKALGERYARTNEMIVVHMNTALQEYHVGKRLARLLKCEAISGCLHGVPKRRWALSYSYWQWRKDWASQTIDS